MSGADYGSPTPSTLFFAGALTTLMITVPIVDDTISELSPEEFTVMLKLIYSATASNVIIAPKSTRVLIVDNDCE